MASLTSILDMVKVMCFAIQEGKIAVHCHAGLGRTGTVIYKQPLSINIVSSNSTLNPRLLQRDFLDINAALNRFS